jgi:hypothetical protein
MHYSANAFSVNGQKTIVALKEGGDKMGQREGLSDSDIQKIQKMYKCKADPSAAGTTQAPNPNPASSETPSTNTPTIIEPKVEGIYEKIDSILKKIGKDQEKVLKISIETKLDDKL